MPTVSTLNDDGSTSYRIITGRKFTIPAHPDVDAADVPGSIIAAALDALEQLADNTNSVQTDPTLSQLGRWRKLDAIQRASITKVAMLQGQLAGFEQGIADRVSAHLAVPPLLPTQVVIAAEDAEIRSWWRDGAGDGDKTAVLQNAATDPQCERVLVAFLRSPIPARSDASTRMMQETWAGVRNAADPSEHDAIEGARLALSWARAALALIASIVHQLVLTFGERDKAALLKLLQEDEDQRVRDGCSIYGYQSGEIARMQRLLAAERIAKKP